MSRADTKSDTVSDLGVFGIDVQIISNTLLQNKRGGALVTAAMCLRLTSLCYNQKLQALIYPVQSFTRQRLSQPITAAFVPHRMTSQNHFHNICIVGNIASGKSTLTRLVANEIPDSTAILESFDQNPFLEWNFQNPQRWAFTNAVRYFYDYLRVWREQTANSAYAHHFIDAGAPTNRYVYGEHMRAEGIVTSAEFDFYETLCSVIECAFAYTPPDAYIFVETAPEICFERMTARARNQTWAYQQPISLEYLRGLVKYFHAFRDSLRAQAIPLLIVQNDADDFYNPEKQTAIVRTVKTFLSDPASEAFV